MNIRPTFPVLWTPVLWLLAVGSTLSAMPNEGNPAEAIAAVRQGIEAQFEAQNGFGFLSFNCNLRTTHPEEAFDCWAVDEEGDELGYVLSPEGEGEFTVTLVTTSPHTVPAELLAQLDSRCTSLLEHYQLSQWEEFWTELGPDLRAEMTAEQVSAQLGDLRQKLGPLEIGPPSKISVRSNGGFELQYVLPAESSEARFRCGFWGTDEEPEVYAFLLVIAPGSEVHDQLLSDRIVGPLSKVIDREVVKAEPRVEALARVGDGIESRGWLADGTEFPLWVERTGRDDDFESEDFHFWVLDVPLLFTAHLKSKGAPVESISCPSPAVPSGETLACTVLLEGDQRYDLHVQRDRSQYKILKFELRQP